MGSEATITVLVDNTAAAGLEPEHGLALWLEVDGLRVLFDTGQGGALPTNAQRLGVDVAEADHIVLSHGHHDHAGALAWVLERNDHATVHLHAAAARDRYSLRDDQPRAVGMPKRAVSALARLPETRVHRVAAPCRLGDRMGLTGPVPQDTAFEDAGGPFFLNPEGDEADALEDDQALWIATDEGLVVCLGCAHAGVVNTLHHARRVSGVDRVRAVVGGLHLGSASEGRLAATAEALRALAPDVVAPCHCTGADATKRLTETLADAVEPPRAGSILRF